MTERWEAGNYYIVFWSVTSKAEFRSERPVLFLYEVESLLTHVSVKGAVQAALQRLQTNNKLMTRTSLTLLHIADLLEFVSKSTYLTNKESLYEQKEGVAMSSLVSAVVANLYTEVFENQP